MHPESGGGSGGDDAARGEYESALRRFKKAPDPDPAAPEAAPEAPTKPPVPIEASGPSKTFLETDAVPEPVVSDATIQEVPPAGAPAAAAGVTDDRPTLVEQRDEPRGPGNLGVSTINETVVSPPNEGSTPRPRVDADGFTQAATRVPTPPSARGGVLPSNRGATPRPGSSPSDLRSKQQTTEGKDPSRRSSLLLSGAGGKGAGETPSLFDNGKYEILKEVARGGMGAVYKARQRDLNRVVALKVMLSGALASEGEKKRFLREAEASAKLKHPNIVPVYDIGEVDGNLYFTMDFVEGAPLSERKTQFDRAKLLDVMIKTCDGVAYAHMRGIIHRDLKPANVMIDARGEPLIMDFGLAKETAAAEDDSGAADLRTREGSIMGTPHYMPPEQALGLVSEIDTRSDVYALGVMLYELWTGRLPFNAKRVSDLIMLVIDGEAASPRSLDPSVPWEIEAIALKAMDKVKDRRYESALELKRDLERFKSGEAIAAKKANAVYRARKWVRRNRVALGAGVVAAGVVAALGSFAVAERNRAERERLAAAERTIDAAATQRVVDAEREKVLEGAVASLAADRAHMGSRGDALRSSEQAIDALGNSFVESRSKLAPLQGLPRALDDRQSDELEALRKSENALAAVKGTLAAVRVEEDHSAEARKKFEQARKGFDAAKARTGLATDADVEAAIAEARNDCLAAITLEPKEDKSSLTSLLREMELWTSASKTKIAKAALAATATAKEQEAEAKLEEARDRTKPIEARLRLIQDALTVAGEGIKADPDRKKLGAIQDELKLLYAGSLAEEGYYKLAEIAASAVANEQGKALVAEIRSKGALALASKSAVASAEDDLKGSRDDQAARIEACERALAKLSNVNRAILEVNDRDRFDAATTTAKVDAAEAKAQLLVIQAARYTASEGEDKPGLADKKWAAAIAALADLPKALEGVATVDPARIAAQVARAEGARGRLHLAVAKRLRAARDATGALGEAELAETALGLGKLGAEHDEAGAIVRDLTRELERPAGMVLIPELSSLPLGGDERNPDHTVTTLRAFYIAQTETTNEDWQRFVDDKGYEKDALWDPAAPRASFKDSTGRPGPADWEKGAPPKGREKMPVAFVSYYEAEAFARWKGERWRLPTDDEWEAAARVGQKTTAGSGGRSLVELVLHEFPWGDAWGDAGAALAQSRALEPVRPNGVHEADRSESGCYDMAGSVAEWVVSSVGAVPEGHAPVRGGSYLLPLPELMAARHRSLPAKDLRAENVGLRLAQTPKEGK
jgi:formylglycine-generating enzyme required for sulfatase activity/tRNA A-37 threonylcarbamoyl transferase component Bud32